MKQILIAFFLAIASLLPIIQGQAIAAQGQVIVAKTPEKPTLYADMAMGEDGQYRITRITTEESRIDFMTLKPLGFDQRKWDCSRMLFGSFNFSDHRECVPSSSEFRTSVVRRLPTFLLGATTLGASMIFGIIIEESVFDEAAYNQAVAEAVKNSGLEGKREGLIKRYLTLTEIVEERDQELEELFRKYKDEYYNSTVPSKIDKRIEDTSGLYTGDLYADMIIRVNRNALTELKPAAKGGLYLSGTPEEFEAMLAATEESLHLQKLDLETTLKNATRDFPVICGPEHLEPYNLKYDCPPRITGALGAFPVAKAIVVSKNINGALPEVFEAEDSALKAVFRKGKLYLENRTAEMLFITGASLKYRNSSTKALRAAELPPKSGIDATSLYKLLTPDIQKAASFSNMTLQQAEKTPVDMALSITYKVGGEQKTVIGEKVFRLADLISAENPLKNRPSALH